MLKNLKIQNYALIESLNIDFQSGMSVVTGETGAGKSIMIGALALMLGQRADTRVIQQGKTKCVVEALFDVSELALKPLFESLEIDYDDECIIRREITDSGKSRAFVNDMPVNLQQLREVTSRLVDIHSQHENLLLGESQFQLKVLDAIAGTNAELDDYKQKYKAYTALKKQHADLLDAIKQWSDDRDYAQFQFDQLSAMKLVAGEQEELETELDAMNHSEEVKISLAGALNCLNDDNAGINVQLKSVIGYLRKVSQILPQFDIYEQRTESSLIELKDIADDLESQLNNCDYNPERKAFVEERLDQIYSLEQKHRVQTIEELLAIQADFEKKLSLIENSDEELAKLEKQLAQAKQDLQQSGDKLSEKRIGAKSKFEKNVSEQLVQLGMPNANFVVDVVRADEFLPHGCDIVEFLFSANKNHQPQAIAHTASGGELSRLMLVIKSLVSQKTQLPTVILDEIDTGVSGEVAHRMGVIMQQMSQSMQVLTITHLPQIASKGSQHFKVFKRDTESSTLTEIVKLTPEQRVMEIAEMLSGKNPSQAAIDNAKELLS